MVPYLSTTAPPYILYFGPDDHLAVKRKVVETEFQYLRRMDLYQHEHPFRYHIPIPDSVRDRRNTNLEFESCRTQVRDIRGLEKEFTLDDHGFQIVKHGSQLSLSSFQHQPTVESTYFPEIEDLLLKTDPTISRIFFLNWRLRSSDFDEATLPPNKSDPTSFQRPAQRVHVDNSPKGVNDRIETVLKGRFPNLLTRSRVRVINVWRPLSHEVQDYPLAVCDATTVSPGDLVACNQIRQNMTNQTMLVHFDARQQWYYLSRQQPDEVLLMKMYDSDPSVSAKNCPHTAFRDPNCGTNPLPRRSIEVRTLILNCPPGFQDLDFPRGRGRGGARGREVGRVSRVLSQNWVHHS